MDTYLAAHYQIEIEEFYQNSDKETNTLVIKCKNKILKFRIKNKDLDNPPILEIENIVKKECQK